MVSHLKLTAFIVAAMTIAAANVCACASHFADAAAPAVETAHGDHDAHHGDHGGADEIHAAAIEDHHRDGPCAGDCEHDRGDALASAAVKTFVSAPLASPPAMVSEVSAFAALRARAVAADYLPPAWRGPPGVTLVSLKVRLQN